MEKVKYSMPTTQTFSLEGITEALKTLNLGGETATPISEDFDGTISGKLVLTNYSGMTSMQNDGTSNPNAMRGYSIGALEIHGDVTGNDDTILTGRKARLSSSQFKSLSESGVITEANGEAKVINIPVKAEEWTQKRVNAEGNEENVKRYRLSVNVTISETKKAVNNKEAVIAE